MLHNPEIFSSAPVITLLAVAIVSAAVLAIWCRAIIARVGRYAALPTQKVGEDALPSISIIVYSRDSARALERMLPQVLSQDYPAAFEVIVATDGRSMQAEDVVTLLSASHRNLRMTYVPDEAHGLSRKKLAVTLGVKAARYDNVILTDANVEVSPGWLRSFGRRIASGAQVIIGTNNITSRDDHVESWLEAFDTLVDTVCRLSSAIVGKPYRASDCNMAFTRKLFFDNGGFADSASFHHGIDDIFISRITRSAVTAVEISPEAIVELRTDDLHTRHVVDKLRHIFTGKHVNRRMSRFMALFSALAWLWLASAVALIILAYNELILITAAILTGILWILPVTLAWRKSARALRLPFKAWLMLPAMLLRPAYNLIYRLKAHRDREKNFTWTIGY